MQRRKPRRRRTSLALVLLAACGTADVRYVSVAPGETSCAVTSDGHVSCWGRSGRARVAIDDAVEVAGNGVHECARTRSGRVRCWGKVVTIGLQPDARGIADVPLPERATAIAVGGSHACALLESQQVACWGTNERLQLGTQEVGVGPAGAVPPRIVPSLRARALAAGGATTCVVETDGHVTCFGDNTSGALGTSDRAEHDRPVRVAGVDHAVAIATDGYYSCAHRDDGTVWCWGSDTTWGAPDEPRAALAPHAIAGTCTPIHVTDGCAIDKAHALRCWGAPADAWPEVRTTPPCGDGR